MSGCPVISIVLNAHTPFVRHPEQSPCAQESWFFEALSETYLPLLEVFDRLDRDHIPFRMGLSLSPILCHMLTDEFLIKRYLEYTDRQIEFGARELDRLPKRETIRETAKFFYDRILDRRALFTGRYEGNLLKVFEYYQKKGRLELLTTGATHSFLPFYTPYPEAIQAEIEVAIGTYRSRFGKYPQGFWLPELGWTGELDAWFRAYNFAYTIVETHGLVFGRPYAEKGSFYPVRTPSGVLILGRDFYAQEDIEAMASAPEYRDNRRDLGYELPPELLTPFLGSQGGRTGTGYKCWSAGGGLYDPQKAARKAAEQARLFLQNRISRLREAGKFMKEPPLCLCAFEADTFGRRWYEGPEFLETLFRSLWDPQEYGNELQFMTPVEYLYKQDVGSFQVLMPGFSSSGVNGYAESWVDASNDWTYRHTMRAIERMTELADRFPDNTGLKERALNQAAREILLAMASDWSRMLYKQESSEYARNQIESSLRNFTTIYEALGSNYISTEWLTGLERRHNIFPHINYRVFRRKR
ncbi:MAG: DUF1957 domain-containing protein [Treponema sp.]|jgi:1,4-alpha-glucan branching enzyme|nr:DUF1957 domain-containing protein [Treponema sp.]